MENLKIVEFNGQNIVEAQNGKKIKTRPDDFRRLKSKKVVFSMKEPIMETKVEEAQPTWKMPVAEEPVVEASPIPEWKESVVEPVKEEIQIETPKYEWQESPVAEEPAPVYHEEPRRTSYYSAGVPTIKSAENIGDKAEKYKKLATTVDENTYFGKVLLNGVDQIKKLEVLAQDIEGKISESRTVLNQLENKKAIEMSDKKVIEDVLEQTTRINLNDIKVAVEKSKFDKVNSELSRIRESLGSIDEVVKESDSKIAEIENEKSRENRNISSYERQLNAVKDEKKHTCDKLEEDLIKADKVDKTIEAEIRAKEEAEKRLNDLHHEKQEILSGISFLTSTENPKEVTNIKTNPFDSIRVMEEEIGRGRAA